MWGGTQGRPHPSARKGGGSLALTLSQPAAPGRHFVGGSFPAPRLDPRRGAVAPSPHFASSSGTQPATASTATAAPSGRKAEAAAARRRAAEEAAPESHVTRIGCGAFPDTAATPLISLLGPLRSLCLRDAAAAAGCLEMVASAALHELAAAGGDPRDRKGAAAGGGALAKQLESEKELRSAEWGYLRARAGHLLAACAGTEPLFAAFLAAICGDPSTWPARHPPGGRPLASTPAATTAWPRPRPRDVARAARASGGLAGGILLLEERIMASAASAEEEAESRRASAAAAAPRTKRAKGPAAPPAAAPSRSPQPQPQPPQPQLIQGGAPPLLLLSSFACGALVTPAPAEGSEDAEAWEELAALYESLGEAQVASVVYGQRFGGARDEAPAAAAAAGGGGEGGGEGGEEEEEEKKEGKGGGGSGPGRKRPRDAAGNAPALAAPAPAAPSGPRLPPRSSRLGSVTQRALALRLLGDVDSAAEEASMVAWVGLWWARSS